MRGGSYLCHDSYCNRYRVAARSSNTGGIAIEAFTSDLFLEPVRKGLAAVLLVLGMLHSAGSAVR
jgi:hypothetical protein